MLYQLQCGKFRVIGFGSRTLTPAERNYRLHSGKLEFLAFKWAVCEKFRDYLYYAPHFTIYTDNNPLTYIMSMAKFNAAGHKWVGELADFKFSILLMGRQDVVLPQVAYVPSGIGRRRWRHCQVLMDQFWIQYIRSYLPTLQTRQKWQRLAGNVTVDSVFLIIDLSLP